MAACSTGEEAYTIALLLEEHIQTYKLPIDFKLFATDLSQKAITLAGRGQYTEQIEAQIPSHLLKKYFHKKGSYYEVNKELRKKIIFSVHNILIDPPFIRLNLLTCRNLFIYLQEEVQKKLLYTFNYSLNSDGFLMLGANETDGDMQEIFEKVDNKSKIFKNKISSKRFRTDYISSFDYPKSLPLEYSIPPRTRSIPNSEQESYAEILVEAYVPDCLLISAANEVVYTSGNIEKYIRFPNNRANLDIFDMISGNLSLAIRNGLNKARETNSDVLIKDVSGFPDNSTAVVDLRFSPKKNRSTIKNPIVIEFCGSTTKLENHQPIEISSKDLVKEIERLEIELHQSRKELQYNSDELEAINEELQSSNEEMKSSNEEMQTTNEELQSTNEELKTVNMELQNKIEEITVLHDDVNNLFISTEVATIFLDRNLRIRKYTPSVQRYFNIREGDIGRPIYHYTYNFTYEDLKKDLNKVLQSLQPLKKEIVEKKGFSILKIIPYKTDDMRIEGLIMTFTDISDLKETNLKLERSAVNLIKRTHELEQSEAYWRSLIENTPDIIARLDTKGHIKYVNESLISHFEKIPEEVIGQSVTSIFNNDALETKKLFQKTNEVFKTKNTVNLFHDCHINDSVKNFYITLLPERSSTNNELVSVLLIGRDITELREAEKRVENKRRKLEELNGYLDNFVHAVAHDLRAPITNLKLIQELIKDESDIDKRNSLIEKVNTSVNRIDDILNGLIEIVDSQLDCEESAKTIDFEVVIPKVLHQISQDLGAPDDLKINLKIKTIKHVRGYLYSILRNVITNAVKYKHPDRPLKLEITTKKAEGFVLLTINDNGIGMDVEKNKQNMFKPFKRFSQQTEGKGIGLHIIKSMIEKTGGKIEVESEENKGTTFYIFLKPQ